MASSQHGGGSEQVQPRGPYTGSHMLNVKNARLRSEHDVSLLRNRLERLRQEERKALKKIEETRRRADQIVALKTRNEENHMRKLLEAEYANQQLERARQRLQVRIRKNAAFPQAPIRARARLAPSRACPVQRLRGDSVGARSRPGLARA